MKNLSILKTQSNNHYLINTSSKYHIFIPPIILFFIENNIENDFEKHPLPNQIVLENHEYKTEEIEYYFKKYLFLKQSGLLDNRDIPNQEKLSGLIHKDSIKWQLSNLTQLVFEVTDSCNLKCKYCGYGEFYYENDKQKNQFMTFETARTVIDYLAGFWESDLNHSLKKGIRLGFYGGEPLINMNLIKRIIEYVETLHLSQVKFTFGMTTNGMLLDKHMDYLIEKNFHILVSLDGNKVNQSYRVLHDGSNSFDKVYKNLQLLRSTHPTYFDTNINFNSVLHNRNSIAQTHTFIKNEFGKVPRISELSPYGIIQVKRKEFITIYKNAKNDLEQSENFEQLYTEIGINNVDFSKSVKYIHKHSGNIFRRYSDFFKNESKSKYIPTGTCFPFERKMFVTVTGNLLPCERIDQNYYLGKITDNKVDLVFEDIALKINNYFKKLNRQCGCCYFYSSCPQCIYQIENLEENPICNQFISLDEFDEYSAEILSYIEKNPEVYKKAFDIFFE